MRDALNDWLRPIPEIPAWMLFLRCFWIAVQLIAAYCLANQVSPFFYQRF